MNNVLVNRKRKKLHKDIKVFDSILDEMTRYFSDLATTRDERCFWGDKFNIKQKE